MRLLGDISMRPATVADSLTSATQRTEQAIRMNVNIAVASSGRDEIACAMRALLAEHAAAGTPLSIGDILPA
ncbi:undecaprenyl diphosphate synthase family protein [Myxococcus sp. AM011]|uniref:undecaprenyl diphosphate synthase family protein n=1 Tax=Myxococcus sp. AM011 TaxID=2745200 RepID=UPI0034CE0491